MAEKVLRGCRGNGIGGGDGISGKEAAGDEALDEFDLAGGEGGWMGPGKGAVEDFVIEELVGDLGKSFGGKDWDGKSEAVLVIVIVLGDNGGEPLGKFHQPGKPENAEVPGEVKIIKEDFGHGGVGCCRPIAPSAGDFLQNLFHIGVGHIGFSEPVDDKIELFLQFHGGAEVGQAEWVGEGAQLFHGGLSFFQEGHSVGGREGFEHQVVVIGHIILAAEKVIIPTVIRGVRNYDRGVGATCLEENKNDSTNRKDRQAAHHMNLCWKKNKRKGRFFD